MIKRNSHYFAAFCLLCILFVTWFINLDFTQFQPYRANFSQQNSSPNSINVNSTRDLILLFNKNNYSTPLQDNSPIPKLFLTSIPDDFKNIKDVKQKKSIFIRFMLPIIIEEQKYLRQRRDLARLLLSNTDKLRQPEVIEWFSKAMLEYRIDSTLSFTQQKNELLARLDELPLTLILAQAAIESAWGTSRFAIEGNSLFGQWSFSGKGGMTPKNRTKGKTHQIKSFPSLQASIRSYLKNINRNRAYKELRMSRAEMRNQNIKLDSYKLASGLHRYSQLGEEYINIIRQLLNTSDFKKLESII